VVPCSLTVEGALHDGATIRLRGGSTIGFPKKSLGLSLAKGDTLANGEDTLVLRSEYTDKTMLRDFLSISVFREIAKVPVVRAEYVHVRVNARYYGVFLHAEHIDKAFVKARGFDTKGALYEGDPLLVMANPGANFTPLPSLAAYQAVYQQHLAGKEGWKDLIGFIEKTLTLADTTLATTLPQQLDVDAYLRYLAGVSIIQSADHVRKNWYMFRNGAQGELRWQIWPWDLDLTWGHLWTEGGEVLDETLFTDMPIDLGVQHPGNQFFNRLIDRVLKTPALRTQYEALVTAYANQAYTSGFLDKRIAWVLCRIAPDLAADRSKRGTNAEFMARVEELRTFAKTRKAFLKTTLPGVQAWQ